MPDYNNTMPPIVLFAGDVGFSFNCEAFPQKEAAGAQFSVGFPDRSEYGFAVRWQTLFGSEPQAVLVELQSADHDVDAEYKTIDRSAAVSGEARTVIGVQGAFLRAKFCKAHGGQGLTVKVMV